MSVTDCTDRDVVQPSPTENFDVHRDATVDWNGVCRPAPNVPSEERARSGTADGDELGVAWRRPRSADGVGGGTPTESFGPPEHEQGAADQQHANSGGRGADKGETDHVEVPPRQASRAAAV